MCFSTGQFFFFLINFPPLTPCSLVPSFLSSSNLLFSFFICLLIISSSCSFTALFPRSQFLWPLCLLIFSSSHVLVFLSITCFFLLSFPTSITSSSLSVPLLLHFLVSSSRPAVPCDLVPSSLCSLMSLSPHPLVSSAPGVIPLSQSAAKTRSQIKWQTDFQSGPRQDLEAG